MKSEEQVWEAARYLATWYEQAKRIDKELGIKMKKLIEIMAWVLDDPAGDAFQWALDEDKESYRQFVEQESKRKPN